MCLGKGAGNGIILTREAAYDHVSRGDFSLAGFGLVKNRGYVLVYNGVLAKALCIAAGGKLSPLCSGRLPLVGPDGFEGPCGRQGKLGVRGVAVAFKAKAKPADPSKELGNFDLVGHVSPIAPVTYFFLSRLTDRASQINMPTRSISINPCGYCSLDT